MKSIVYTHNGPADVLHLVERPVPEPGIGEVRVRMVVSGVNPTDWKSRVGAGDGAQLPEPRVPNQDGAGVIDACGGGVRDLAVGDRVWVWDAAFERPEGTAQHYVVLPLNQVVPLPDRVSFDVGASLGIPALTAHRALTCVDGGAAVLAPGALAGRTVLVTGGAGAVSHAAIQLATWAGAVVVTTVSSQGKADLARRAGAHHVVNYREENVVERVLELAPGGVDTVVEVNATANLASSVAVIAPGGTIAIYTSEEPEFLPVPVRQSMTKNIRYQFILTYTTTPQQKADAVRAVAAAAADGALEVGEEHGLPTTRFPLAATADAHRAVENQTVGKVLIDIRQ
ncbi:NADPH2:quinone reductase [Glaciihabitans tibetensis]|uniref:NADPH2:quinone reductase n=1 Tax=Glaciihabitans tibetensis TaxID=1266600 RepID=A0A2T0VK76_9MICO|nr:NADPH:quinone reductase [Glaciihabitans tibetensis]PRY70604.1 NADPH2:quinone reductase [Glaciihabitans tibetensis]